MRLNANYMLPTDDLFADEARRAVEARSRQVFLDEWAVEEIAAGLAAREAMLER